MENAERYPSETVRNARDEATARLEEAARVAFAPRVVTETLSGDATTRLLLTNVESTVVLYLEVDDEPIDLDADSLQVDTSGVVIRTDGEVWPRGVNNIIVQYQHGYVTTPAPVHRAAMRLALEDLVPTALPTRAMSQSTDLGEIRFSMANPEAGRPTGDPEVDAVIYLFGRNRPSVG
jgi:hypothetical protein